MSNLSDFFFHLWKLIFSSLREWVKNLKNDYKNGNYSILDTSRDYDIFYIYRYMFSRLDHTILVGVCSFEPKEMDLKVLLMNQHVTRIQKTCWKLI